MMTANTIAVLSRPSFHAYLHSEELARVKFLPQGVAHVNIDSSKMV